MDIKSISNSNNTIKYGQKKEVKNEEKEKNKSNSQKANLNEPVKYVKTENTQNKGMVYNRATIEKLKVESEKRYANLRAMVEELLKKQGLTFKDAIHAESIKVDEETRQKAMKAIGDGGEYSIDAVATRIVDFAKAISGGDKSKLQTLKNAIKEGFEEAKKVLGGTLPEISEKTYDEVMNRLDSWEKET